MRRSLFAICTMAAVLIVSFSQVRVLAGPVSPTGAAYSWGAWRHYLQQYSHLPPVHYRGERPSHMLVHPLRRGGTLKQAGIGQSMIQFPSAIQHVVIIYMENRSMDNLFAGLHDTPYPLGGTWGSQLILCDPNHQSGCGGFGPLTKYELYGTESAEFDPSHNHAGAFYNEANGIGQPRRLGARIP